MGRINLIIIVLALSLLTPEVNGQDSLRTSERKATQKILLHFDKGSYYAGDTLFFKAYLYSDYTVDLSATNLLVALYNGMGKKITEKRFPVFEGSCIGSIELTDSTEHGLYYFQAITPEQLMRQDSIGFIRQVFVYNPAKVPWYLREPVSSDYRIRFYPQGGELVEGFSNQVMFTATDQYGNPAAVKAEILDEKQNIVTTFSSASGKGSLFLFPEMETYTARIRFPDEKEKLIVLPRVRSKGAILRIDGNGDEKKYFIEVSDSVEKEGLTLLGVMNERPVIQLPLKSHDNSFNGIIPTSKMPSGILFLALSDKQGTILAENHFSIDNKDYKAAVDLLINSLDLEEDGKNVLTFDFRDSVWASLSLSIVDPASAEPMISIGSNILEDALFNNELTGPKGEPRRVDWKKIFSDSTNVDPAREDFITISGTVYKEGTSNLVPGGGQLNFMVTTKDSVNTYLLTTVDSSGRFNLNNLVFADTARFSFGMSKGKTGSRNVSIKLDDPRYRMPSGLPLLPALPQLYYDKIYLEDTTLKNPLIARYDSLLKGGGKYKLMEEARVFTTIKKRNPTLLVNEQYTSGLFSAMGMAKIVDLINFPPKGGGNLFDYLNFKLSGVRFIRSGFEYTMKTFRTPLIGSFNPGPGGGPTSTGFYLNEIEVRSSDISMIPLSEIAMVKYFPPGTTQLSFTGISPVLAVYTKQGSDYYQGFGTMNFFRFRGYDQPGLQFDDKYNQYHSDKMGDVLWKPDLFLTGESNKLIVRFVNPARAGSFRVLLQGVTRDGELIYLERTISSK